MAYYIQIRGKAFGPFDTEQLKEMKDNGKLGKSTAISENKIDWFSAENLDFLFPSPAQPNDSQLQTNSHNTPINPMHSIPEPANWFYSYNGVDGFGPVTATAIIQMINSKTLNAESVAWQDGQFAKKLNELPKFAELFNTQSTQNQHGQNQHNTDQYLNSNTPATQTDTTGIGYADVLKKYADFNGRARRKEYWNFTIYNMIILPLLLISIGIITIFLMTVFKTAVEAKQIAVIVLFALYLIYNLLIFLPSLAVGIRRLHDTGNSGWMLLIALVPIVGTIILLVFLTQDSQPGNNQYGQNPKYKY